MPRKTNKKRADGRFAVQVYVGTVDGKRKYKTAYGSTQKEADANAELIKLKLNKGMDVVKDTDTFSQWAERWLEIKKLEVGESQYKSQQSNTNKFNEYMANIPLKVIQAINLQQVINDYAQCNPTTHKPSSKKLLKEMRLTALQIFKFAIENRAVEFNPAEYIKIPKDAPQQKRRALTKEEQELIVNTEHRLKTAAMLMLFAGLRRGELIPLRWDDVDLRRRTISINKAVKFVGNNPVLKDTKTKSGNRLIYISRLLADYLATVDKNNVLVCPSLNGDMFTQSSWDRAWESYLNTIDANMQGVNKFSPKREHKLDNITPHMLRHTFATLMYENGVDALTAQNQMGHADIRTTLNIYTHLNDSHAKKEMQKMNKLG